MIGFKLTILIFFTGLAGMLFAQVGSFYPISEEFDQRNSLLNRVNCPEGFTRVELERGSFGQWLRSYPLLPGRGNVMLFNGDPKPRQDVHFAVLDLPLSTGDLQQCADAVIRMRAEYLFYTDKADAIHFNYTSGDQINYSDWVAGKRPVVNGNQVSWKQYSATQIDRNSFESYIKNVFTYAGSHSLQQELKQVEDGKALPGDVLIQGGFPGHAMLVMDVAMNEEGEQIILLAQSYMPAQQMHIVKNSTGGIQQPWIPFDNEAVTSTPEWSFQSNSLFRFH